MHTSGPLCSAEPRREPCNNRGTTQAPPEVADGTTACPESSTSITEPTPTGLRARPSNVENRWTLAACRKQPPFLDLSGGLRPPSPGAAIAGRRSAFICRSGAAPPPIREQKACQGLCRQSTDGGHRHRRSPRSGCSPQLGPRPDCRDEEAPPAAEPTRHPQAPRHPLGPVAAGAWSCRVTIPALAPDPPDPQPDGARSCHPATSAAASSDCAARRGLGRSRPAGHLGIGAARWNPRRTASSGRTRRLLWPGEPR
mmetsp:Transcript_15756/g.38095  ORF Transcript_15756/g.38095 Transcript_15756/m.38095 type:complete len:255 (+) Transcript_15756:289-1053(+)